MIRLFWLISLQLLLHLLQLLLSLLLLLLEARYLAGPELLVILLGLPPDGLLGLSCRIDCLLHLFVVLEHAFHGVGNGDIPMHFGALQGRVEHLLHLGLRSFRHLMDRDSVGLQSSVQPEGLLQMLPALHGVRLNLFL